MEQFRNYQTCSLSELAFHQIPCINQWYLAFLILPPKNQQDHLVAREETRKEGETDLVVLCSEGSESSIQSDQSHSDRKWTDQGYRRTHSILDIRFSSFLWTISAGEIISELVSTMEHSGTKYTALYVSDPYWYTSYKTLQRLLAETATGNTTDKASTTCDELCKFKSSLLEGILVVKVITFF